MASSSSSLRVRALIHDPVDTVEHLAGTPIVIAAFESGAQFLEAYGDAGAAGELAVVTRAAPPSGSEVVLEIHWADLPNPVFVRASVLRRRLGLLARLHADAAQTRDFLLRMAWGVPSSVPRRRQKRYCVRLPVTWRRFGDYRQWPGTAEDLSAGGVLVSTTMPAPPIGERVAVRMVADSQGQDIIVTGMVRHTRERSGDSAFGLQFECRSSGEQRRLRHLLRAFAARGVVLLAPTR
jgi:hypothetical protein